MKIKTEEMEYKKELSSYFQLRKKMMKKQWVSGREEEKEKKMHQKGSV